MKAAVSIPTPVFKHADALAKRRGVSRSSLFTEALREYLLRNETNALRKAMSRAHAKAKKSDVLWEEAAVRTLRDIEWEE
jgi:metal-responsive CopG/Arc/MetJ family transcriptional regulator